MSNEQKNDLDEQLFILLASMKEYREAIADDKKRLEQFYRYVANSVSNELKETIGTTQAHFLHKIDDSTRKIEQISKQLSPMLILLFGVGFIALVSIFMVTVFFFIPSLDDIKQRRTEVAYLEQAHKIDLQKCKGQACVRVMKKQCGYGENHDLCVIDPK